MNKNKGFTLIELLVVIAIIGILASVVLASLNSARNKGADAAIKSNLTNLRAQAAIYYDNNSSLYNTGAATCTVSADGTVGTTSGECTSGLITDTTFVAGLKAAAKASGSTLTYMNDDATSTQKWATQIALKSTPATYYCVDSTGQSKETSIALANSACQ